MYFSLFLSAKKLEEEKPEQDLVRSLMLFQRDLLFWGSDATIAAWAKAKEEFSRLADTPAGANFEKTGRVFDLMSKVLIQMRRDVGYSFTSVNETTLATMMLDLNDPKLKSAILKKK